MKKIYSTILAALCVFGASAADLQLKTLAPQKQVGAINKIAFTKQNNAPESNIRLKADETFDIEGTYDVVIGDYYFDASEGPIQETAEVTKNGDGTITISCDYFISDVVGNYDESTGAITFPSAKLGTTTVSGTTYYIKFMPTQYTSGVGIEETLYTATFDASTGEIAFPTHCGFGWGAYGNSLYVSRVGWFDLFDIDEMILQGAAEPIDEVQEGQWKSIGTATLEDAWITPSYTATATGAQFIPSENPIEAELQQDVNNENRYRLWRPFHDTNWALVGNNLSTFDGQIVFDITDPDHVVVEAGMPAGFKNSNGDFYVYGLLGWQISGYGDAYNADTHLQGIIDFMIEKGQVFDTYADGVVYVNRSVFDTNKKVQNAYTWNGNEYIVSKITFPKDIAAIGSVESDDQNAPVEYFNLQGMKVENPAQGQIVIRRQGSQVSKMLVK